MQEDIYFSNWEILKPLILAKWPKLKKSDLDGVQPVISKLIPVIQAKYEDYPKQSIKEDLLNLGQQILKNP
jgi:hypothetical protein